MNDPVLCSAELLPASQGSDAQYGYQYWQTCFWCMIHCYTQLTCCLQVSSNAQYGLDVFDAKYCCIIVNVCLQVKVPMAIMEAHLSLAAQQP